MLFLSGSVSGHVRELWRQPFGPIDCDFTNFVQQYEGSPSTFLHLCFLRFYLFLCHAGARVSRRHCTRSLPVQLTAIAQPVPYGRVPYVPSVLHSHQVPNTTCLRPFRVYELLSRTSLARLGVSSDGLNLESILSIHHQWQLCNTTRLTSPSVL